MKLLDFHNSDELNRLRQVMGDIHLGKFELFDPIRHLTAQERSQLQNNILDVSVQEFFACKDKSLGYKNSKVLAVRKEYYHFAMCDKLLKGIKQGTVTNLSITFNADLLLKKDVCEYCLHAIAFQGFDAYRKRHQEYNHKIVKEFDLHRYLKARKRVLDK